jgi:hypothetical protein
MRESLPLFDDLDSLDKTGNSSRLRPAPDEHLLAARKLEKVIRRVPKRSAAQVRIGQLLCGHLIAMLNADYSSDDSRHAVSVRNAVSARNAVSTQNADSAQNASDATNAADAKNDIAHPRAPNASTRP